MNKQTVANERIGESYRKIKHPSGLTVYLYPMKGFVTSYAVMGTRYGSVDCRFKTGRDEDFVTVPNGIAHYLEHKLFENEDCDAFARFAKTGASANAFTSFDRTCYLFSASSRLPENLEILLDFVTSPYFTPETVEKERGIITQEIRMYDDNPDWRVFFNLLSALYHVNPVKIDIAGTAESIQKIDAPLLYRCYNTFYNLNNMALAVAGNFSEEEVLAVCDRVLKKAEDITVESVPPKEPELPVKQYAEQKLPVSLPMFHIGFKETPWDEGGFGEQKGMSYAHSCAEVFLEIFCGEASPLYRELYDQNLINASFGSELMMGRGYSCFIFAGESKDPKAVYSRILSALEDYRRKGIDPEEFETARKAVYGRIVRGYNNIESTANGLVLSHFYGITLFSSLESVSAMTLDDVNALLKTCLKRERGALSVILPA